jgi:glucokinase
LALIFGASGGVFLGSGIPPRIVDVLDRGGFRAAFERKPPFEAVMGSIPTFVIIHPEPAMAGLAMIASHPDRLVFEGYGWRSPEERVP